MDNLIDSNLVEAFVLVWGWPVAGERERCENLVLAQIQEGLRGLVIDRKGNWSLLCLPVSKKYRHYLAEIADSDA